MMLKLLTLLGLVATAYAACDNHCSGHGTCSSDDVCTCYDNWRMGDTERGDCSDRVCPYELAWVDNPDANGFVHHYAECAGRGLCDRETGECECFEGYEGKGCQRTTCPNDCSGHGTCEYVEDLPYGSVWGDWASSLGVSAYTFSESGLNYIWDTTKTRGCNCDPQWTDVDCSRRMCPKSNDVMDRRDDVSDTLLYDVQTIVLNMRTNLTSSNSFALTFVTTIGESYTTIPLATPVTSSMLTNSSLLADQIEDALEDLPNHVIDDVKVTVTAVGVERLTIAVTFQGDAVQGEQNLLMVEAEPCEAGCTPRIAGLELMEWTNNGGTVTRTTNADYNNYECGRRGHCDYETGLCECFEGYTGLACNAQTALV